jgi:DNA-binding NarL/FixJ family response regulator
MQTIRLLLVDDEPTIRRGLRMRLELEPDVQVIGEAADGAAAVDLAGRLRPNVVLMDVEMPGMDGIAATSQIRAAAVRPSVVMLSMHDDEATVARAKAAGASAFIAKHRIDDALLTAIRTAAQEEGVP